MAAAARLPRPIAAAIVVLMTAASPAAAQAPSPAAQTTTAVTRLVADTGAVTDAQAPNGTRAKLVADAGRVQRLFVKNPCRAARYVESYREALSGVDASTPKTAGDVPGPPSLRGKLDRDALAVDAGVKQFGKTRRCGGGVAAAKSSSVDADVAGSSKRTLRLRVRLPRARWEAFSGGGADFIGLNMDGADPTGGVGDPGVPAFTRLFAVPRGARVSVKVSNARSYTLGDVDVMPKQEQAVDRLPGDELPPETFATKPFKIDRRAYRARGKLPARLAYVTTLGRLRDVTIAGVQVPGAQYDRRKRALEVFTSMDVTVTFKGGGRWLQDRPRTAREKPFERIYSSTLENYSTVARAPEVRKSGGTDADAQEFIPPCGEEYLIVTSPTLRPAADTLANAKQA